MKPETLPIAFGAEPQCVGPFSIRTSQAGNAYLQVMGTGMAFTACLTAPQLRQLAAMAHAAADEIEPPAAPLPTNVVSIFRGR